MRNKTIVITAILIASSMAMSGCAGEDSSDSCQIVDEGEYRSVDSSGEVLGYFRVVGSSQAESPPYSAADEGSCLLEVDIMLPKIVSGKATGFYLFVGAHSENANDAFTFPLMVSGDRDNPVLVDYDCSGCGSENEVRDYHNDTGALLDSGNVDWTVGSEETDYGIWEICEGCFETEMSGYVGNGAMGWSVYTESDGTTSYDDTDGDGVNDKDEVAGCTDATANNHASTATDDDGSCDFDLDDDGVLDANEVAGCTNATASNYDSSATDEDGSCEFWTAKVSVIDVFVNSNTEASSDNNSSSEAKVDSILVIAKLAAGSEDTNVSVIYYSIMCGPEEQGLVFANGTLADSTPAKLDGSLLTNESTLNAGTTFRFIVQLGDCEASVGDILELLTIVEEGGGELRVSLEVDSTTVGKSIG